MAYAVDRVVICDAYAEPDAHYQLLPGGEPVRRYAAVAGAAQRLRQSRTGLDKKGPRQLNSTFASSER